MAEHTHTHTPQPPSRRSLLLYPTRGSEAAGHTDTAAAPRPYTELMADMALTVDEKKPFLLFSGSAKFPAAPPPPGRRRLLPRRRAAPSPGSAS